MPDISLKNQNSLINKEIFLLCKKFLQTKDYSVLDELVIQLEFYKCYRYNNEVYHSLLAGSLLFFIYNNVLTRELQYYYIDIHTYLISFYNDTQREVLRYHNILNENNEKDMNYLLFNFILTGYYHYTQDDKFKPDIENMDIDRLINDLYLSNYTSLNDIEIFGLIFSYNELKHKLIPRTKDRLFRYIWEIITILFEQEEEVFNTNNKHEDQIDIDSIEKNIDALKI